jgi:hypothetical protein
MRRKMRKNEILSFIQKEYQQSGWNVLPLKSKEIDLMIFKKHDRNFFSIGFLKYGGKISSKEAENILDNLWAKLGIDYSIDKSKLKNITELHEFYNGRLKIFRFEGKMDDFDGLRIFGREFEQNFFCRIVIMMAVLYYEK